MPARLVLVDEPWAKYHMTRAHGRALLRKADERSIADGVMSPGQARAEHHVAHRHVAGEVRADEAIVLEQHIHRAGLRSHGGGTGDADRGAALQVRHERHAILPALRKLEQRRPGATQESQLLDALERDREIAR